MSPFGTTTTHKLLPYIHTLQRRLVCFTSQASGLLRRPAWLSQSYARPIAHFGTLTLPCLCLESRSHIQDIHTGAAQRTAVRNQEYNTKACTTELPSSIIIHASRSDSRSYRDGHSGGCRQRDWTGSEQRWIRWNQSAPAGWRRRR